MVHLLTVFSLSHTLGQFPSSFVEPVDIPALKQGEKLFVCTSNFTSQEPGSLTLQRGTCDSLLLIWLLFISYSYITPFFY